MNGSDWIPSSAPFLPFNERSNMTHHWDEFSKSLAEESLPRRESLRRIGTMLAGAVLAPLGLESAWAAPKGPKADPCTAFCKSLSNDRAWQQNYCLPVCNACHSDPGRLCRIGSALICTDNDVRHCGACGLDCRDGAGNYEDARCIDAECVYTCTRDLCDGTCTDVSLDPDNCGACGNVCGEAMPYCNQGTCSECRAWEAICGGACMDILWDSNNCGGCGIVCPEDRFCEWGGCTGLYCSPDHPDYPNC
jgi:hypothetical protein